MVAGINLVSRRPPPRGHGHRPTLFVGMLALGVIIISRAPTFSTRLTGFLFGNVLGVTTGDLTAQAGAAVLTVGLPSRCTGPSRPGLQPRQGRPARAAAPPRQPGAAGLLTRGRRGLVPFRAVGTLLVFGLLVALTATASLLVRRVPTMMVTAAALGVASVALGLVLSYHFEHRRRTMAGGGGAGVLRGAVAAAGPSGAARRRAGGP